MVRSGFDGDEIIVVNKAGAKTVVPDRPNYQPEDSMSEQCSRRAPDPDSEVTEIIKSAIKSRVQISAVGVPCFGPQSLDSCRGF